MRSKIRMSRQLDPSSSLRAAAAVVTSLVSLCCGTAQQQPPPDAAGANAPAAAERTTHAASGPKAVVCGVVARGDEVEPELYMLSAMNNKLSLYPDFAAAIGMDSVSDCESARAFYDAYAGYAAEHPDFDAQQPLDPTPVKLPSSPPPPASDEPYETDKIFSGNPGMTRHEVAHLSFRFSVSSSPDLVKFSGKLVHCSGTFISKNWILTAAHCVTPPAIDACVKQGTPIQPGVCDPDWNVWGNWTVQTDEGTLQNVRAVAYTHPDWIGRQPLQNDIFQPLNDQQIKNTVSHDLALLYIPDQGRLPGDVEADHAMRLWTTEPDVFATMTFYGWGLPNRTLLQARSMNGLVFVNLPNQISAITTVDTDPLPCSGDSGGPLVRDVDVVTANGERTVPAIVGVASMGIDPCGPPPSGGSNPPIGTEARWARIDGDMPFIEARMKLWQGRNFECLKEKQVTGNTAEVGECWGSPCSEDGECLDDELCYKPGRDLSDACPICSNAAGCGCVIGQCLKFF